jgi:hypothetical protein
MTKDILTAITITMVITMPVLHGITYRLLQSVFHLAMGIIIHGGDLDIHHGIRHGTLHTMIHTGIGTISRDFSLMDASLRSMDITTHFIIRSSDFMAAFIMTNLTKVFMKVIASLEAM